jgi:hypothetical protein
MKKKSFNKYSILIIRQGGRIENFQHGGNSAKSTEIQLILRVKPRFDIIFLLFFCTKKNKDLKRKRATADKNVSKRKIP